MKRKREHFKCGRIGVCNALSFVHIRMHFTRTAYSKGKSHFVLHVARASLVLYRLSSLFWIKQIQGSVRVKIKEYVHAWSEFLFV